MVLIGLKPILFLSYDRREKKAQFISYYKAYRYNITLLLLLNIVKVYCVVVL